MQSKKENNDYLQCLSQLIDCFNAGIFQIDKSNKITFINKRAENILNIKEKEVIFKDYKNVLPETLANHIYLTQKNPSKESNLSNTLKIKEKEASIEIVILDDTKIETDSLFCIFQDSAVLNNFKSLEEINKLKSDFISQVSHELRTPLTTIRGYSELLMLRSYNEETVRKFAQYINIEAERLTHIMSDLLDIAKIEQRIFEIHKEIFSLPFVIEERIKHYQKKTSLHKLILEVESAEIQVDADKGQIKQVIDNLLDNAIKYSPENSEIKVKIFFAENYKNILSILKKLNINTSQVVVSVNDRGVGISEKELPCLFEKFARGEKIKEKQIKGVGLGLTICKHIIKLHNGAIWVESIEGQGSTFYFTLPIILDLQRHKKVLIVDDEKVVAEMLVHSLQELKYNVVEAYNGEEGLEKAEKIIPDLIITDLRMPKMSGYEMIEKIRSNPKFNNTKILVITGSEDLNVQKVVELGVDEYLSKPFSISILTDTIKKLLRKNKY